jgi:adenylylsulfate kinase-like enzyme
LAGGALALPGPLLGRPQPLRRSKTPEAIAWSIGPECRRCQEIVTKKLFHSLGGEIKGFTGIDAPYEVSHRPEIRLSAAEKSPEQLAQEVIG